MNGKLVTIHSVSPCKQSRQAGMAAVEFAIVIVVLLLIVAGVIGFGRTFWYADALTKATRDGARLLSTWPVDTISSVGVDAARTLTRNSANAANLSPQLTIGNVLAECLNDTFSVVLCTDRTRPQNVRITITSFGVNLGEWFPFIGNNGVISYGSIGLTPHTTMRYMN